ncbi:GNAT family N-acetyltransferase [Chitinimonas koreensis]|uniref:GNAT family N-acetyltransferase n=1 Tax=Chitinimonas koreensis TaxID=356302 RepID=UPI000404EAF2|nr:GNAT family N-acetyltransferase [Chitinimonas koreensis]QNM98487.1 GNAT family N-acetyltransferase [Chitinimonas koreensis]
MNLRTLQPGEDLDQAARLFDAYRQFYGQPSDLTAVRTWLNMRLAAGQSVVMLAEEAGRAVGFMQLYPTFCSVALAPIWVLYDLYVAPEARGLGVADALLQAAARHGREHGAAYLQLSTAHDNAVAQAVYRRNGWQHDEVFRTYTLAL